MVNFLGLFFALVLSTNSFAAVVPSGVPSRSIGGTDGYQLPISILNTDVTYFMINAGVASGTTNNFYPFYKNGVQYQVTAAKTARCEHMVFSSGAGSNLQFALVSSLTSYAQNAASITSGTFSQGATGIPSFNTHPTAGTMKAESIIYEFGALSFPGIQGQSANNFSVQLFCREI
jgi:hypothetical protein